MVVAKALARGVMIVGLAGCVAQAAPMLTLATTSSSSSGTSTVSYAPRYTSPALGLTLATSKFSSAPTSDPAPMPAPAPAPMMARMAAPAPVMAQNIAAPAPAPAASPFVATPAPAGQATADAFLNMGSGPYDAAHSVTAGGAQGWFMSPQITRLFGGTPDAQQRQDFEGSVYNRVVHTFNRAGVPINLTGDGNVPAAHSLSVVSGSYSPLLPAAIGMTQIGGDGFSFIDQAAKAANNVDQLSWIVAHNVAHELMLAFGVDEVHDDTGQYIDSRYANWNMMVNPDSTFSDSATRELLTKDFKARSGGLVLAPQLVDAAPVPEPATLALWSLAASSVALFRVRSARKAAQA